MNTKTYWTITAWHVKQDMFDKDYCISHEEPICSEKDAKNLYKIWAKKYDNVTPTKHIERQIDVMTTCKEYNKTGIS